MDAFGCSRSLRGTGTNLPQLIRGNRVLFHDKSMERADDTNEQDLWTGRWRRGVVG